jgi:hypothetical protein
MRKQRRAPPTWSVEVEEVPDGYRDLVAHGRQSGARVQHVGTKVAQLPGLVVGQRRQTHSLWDLRGIDGRMRRGGSAVLLCTLIVDQPCKAGLHTGSRVQQWCSDAAASAGAQTHVLKDPQQSSSNGTRPAPIRGPAVVAPPAHAARRHVASRDAPAHNTHSNNLKKSRHNCARGGSHQGDHTHPQTTTPACRRRPCPPLSPPSPCVGQRCRLHPHLSRW